ncbi:uncharacterized protein [Antedon mediterranea]|uniref:uncharacterized protein n=1 Tax=Antedon mediterranea TaxID=105859 RepID=UPI003AF40CB0
MVIEIQNCIDILPSQEEKYKKYIIIVNYIPYQCLGLKSIICGFEVDECGFVDVTTDFISLWRRVCDNGCSMISDATASMSGKTMSNLVSPWFFGNSGVLKMQYYIPDKQTAKFASISVYIRYDETASNNNRELIYLASSEMDRPWVPMAAEMDRPWVPMSVNVKMDDSTHFRFEIEGLLEGSSENIFIDNFEFKPKD